MQVRVRNCIFFLGLWAIFTIAPYNQVAAQMSSATYRMPTTVTSGAGGPMESTSFQMNSTAGQPSPLMDPANPPYSDSYDLYPGIWYLFSLVAETCPGDDDGDKDVDGEDLAAYIFDSGGVSLNDFAINFGKIICP